MESEQLLVQGKIFEDEIGAGTKHSDQPAENVSKKRNHGKKSYLMILAGRFVKRLILQVHEVLTRHRGAWGTTSAIGCTEFTLGTDNYCAK